METELTSRRKADRAEMAQQVAALAADYGIGADIHQGIYGPRHTVVDLTMPHGLKLTVDFDGTPGGAGPDVYVLSWHGVERGYRLHWGMFGRVNEYHGHKATDVAYGFAQLLRTLTERFEDIRSGAAFIVTEAPARAVQFIPDDPGEPPF